jgi:hypothetical protein
MNTFYLRYLRSSEWKAKRQSVLERDQYRCQVWFEHHGEEVHHRSYLHLGDEPLEDLVTLCRECHEAITNIVRKARHQERRMKTVDHQRIGIIVQIERKITAPILADVLRYLPLPTERITGHGVSVPVLQDYRRRTPDLP